MEITRRKFLEVSAASAAAGAAKAMAVDTKPSDATKQTTNQSEDLGWAVREGVRQPNILIAVLDDVGFADLSCYGSEYAMPFSDGMAETGTRFNNFHVTAVCAPTRACLFTGRNAHSVGVGNIAE
jgi:arylsulfatase